MFYLLDKQTKKIIGINTINNFGEISPEQELKQSDIIFSDGDIFDPENYVLKVPETVTQRQLRLWLLDNKQLKDSDIKTLLEGNEPALIEWEYASCFERRHQLFDLVGAMLGITPDEIDQMFIEASII
jgi:hypothetical protein